MGQKKQTGGKKAQENVLETDIDREIHSFPHLGNP